MISISFPHWKKEKQRPPLFHKRCSVLPRQMPRLRPIYTMRPEKTRTQTILKLVGIPPLKYILQHVNAKKKKRKKKQEGYMWEHRYSSVSLRSIGRGPLRHSFWEKLHQKQHRASFKSYISIYNIGWVSQWMICLAKRSDDSLGQRAKNGETC